MQSSQTKKLCHNRINDISPVQNHYTDFSRIHGFVPGTEPSALIKQYKSWRICSVSEDEQKQQQNQQDIATVKNLLSKHIWLLELQ